LLEETDNERNAILLAHSVLGHLGIWVATGDVPQGTDGSINDLLTSSSVCDNTKKCLRERNRTLTTEFTFPLLSPDPHPPPFLSLSFSLSLPLPLFLSHLHSMQLANDGLILGIIAGEVRQHTNRAVDNCHVV
jgi:hypothetical protein